MDKKTDISTTEPCEQTDSSLDHILHRSPFIATSLFDVIEGALGPLMRIIELLVAKGVLSMDEVTEILKDEAADYAEHHPAALNRWAAEFIADYVEKGGPDAVAIAR